MKRTAHADPRPDETLVDRCLAGDEGAWATLVRRYANLVYGIADRTGLSDDEAADAFQAVFVIAWRSLGFLSEPRALPGWLTTIARRECLRVARVRARRQRSAERVEADPTSRIRSAGDVPADQALEAEERAAIVRHAVEGLDDRCRELLTLLFWESPAPAYEAVAARLGMPLGSLGPTRGRCLEKLRSSLRELGFS